MRLRLSMPGTPDRTRKLGPPFNVSLCAAVPNARWVENIPQLDTLTTEPRQIKKGHAVPSATPGLGIVWDLDAIKEQTVLGSTFTISWETPHSTLRQRDRHPGGKASEYKRLNLAVWLKLLEISRSYNISNFSIILRESDNLLFSHFECHGSDFASDMARMAADHRTQAWWYLCADLASTRCPHAASENGGPA